eukprot:s3016_g5.t3
MSGSLSMSPEDSSWDVVWGFNRKAFAWGNPEAQQRQEAKNGQHQEESQNRTYEVIAKTGTVKAEPHMDAKLKTKKSKGSRFIVSEMTMNGWLKLENEPGWLAAHLRGVQDIGEVAAPLETDPMLELAVPVYQPQGMVCLEVVFKTGVPVRETPSRKAKTVATLKCGEYVFAHTQNFDGWLKLSGKPEGWVLANDSDWGELLRRRRRMNDIDLWAMCDAWAAARARPGTGRSMGLSGKEVEALKELEERTVMEAKALWQEHRSNKEYLVSEGYLAGEDLLKTETWMRQRVFAHVLEKKSKSGEGWLRELISGFKLSSRVPPLPGIQGEQEEDDYYAEQQAQAQSFSQGLRKGFTNANGGAVGGPMGGAMGGQQGHGAFDPAFEGTKPFEYKGKIYTMAPNGVLFDPPNQVPMGIWNPDTQRLDPAAGMMPGCPYPAISYLGRTYILLPDQRLLDPETEEIVGTFNRDTNEMDLQNPTLLQEVGFVERVQDGIGAEEKKRLLDGMKDFLKKVQAAEEKLYMVKAVGKVKGKMETEDGSCRGKSKGITHPVKNLEDFYPLDQELKRLDRLSKAPEKNLSDHDRELVRKRPSLQEDIRRDLAKSGSLLPFEFHRRLQKALIELEKIKAEQAKREAQEAAERKLREEEEALERKRQAHREAEERKELELQAKLEKKRQEAALKPAKAAPQAKKKESRKLQEDIQTDFAGFDVWPQPNCLCQNCADEGMHRQDVVTGSESSSLWKARCRASSVPGSSQM